jgi:ABC-type transport system involved in multi-copper enzyme maturation permease subunit
MIALWIGLPALSILFTFAMPFLEPGAPETFFSLLSALLVSTLGGYLSSLLLVTTIVNEKNQHVYDLFLVRPVKRRNLLLAKFLAVYICVAVASLLAVGLGLLIDYVTGGLPPDLILVNIFHNLVISLSMIALSCAAGILVGVMASSVLLGVIGMLYGGNTLLVVPLLASIFGGMSGMPILGIVIPIVFSIIASIVLLIMAIYAFNRKQF